MSNMNIELTKAQRTAAQQALCNHEIYHRYIKLYKKIEFEWAYRLWGDLVFCGDDDINVHDWLGDEYKKFWCYPELYYDSEYRDKEAYRSPLHEIARMLADSTYLEYKELRKDYLLHNMAMHYVMYERLAKEGK